MIFCLVCTVTLPALCQKSIYSLFSKNFASLSHFFVSYLATFLRKSCFIFLVFFTFCPIFILKSFWCQHKRCHLCFLIDFFVGGGGETLFCSLLLHSICSYKKSNGSISLLSVFTKRATGAMRSCPSLQNNGSDSLWLLFTKREKERRAKE